MIAFAVLLPAAARRSRTTPIGTAPRRSPQAAPVVHNIAERLQEELPTLFSDSPDYSIYSPNVTFEDPVTKFRGISKYASNINFLNKSPVFSSASLTLHHTSIVTSDTVRTRWTLSMVVNLPWSPCVAFTGQSDYVVDLSTGQVVEHYDYWDSLRDSQFFSFPAVADLLAQCRPHVGLTDLGGFDLLRRTQHFQIRRFNHGISLDRVGGTTVDTWQPAQGGDRLSCVAVVVLPSAPSSERDVLDQSNRLRRLLKGKSYATPREKCYYVRSKLRGQVFHEVWLELNDATVFVDT